MCKLTYALIISTLKYYLKKYVASFIYSLIFKISTFKKVNFKDQLDLKYGVYNLT